MKRQQVEFQLRISGRKIWHQGGQTLEEVPRGPVGSPSLEALGAQLPRP